MAEQKDGRDAAVEAFAAVATPDEKAKLELVEAQVAPVVTQAQTIEVRTAAEASSATEFLAQIRRALRQAEDARTFLVKPLRDHVAAINARFKLTSSPLEEADAIVRQKVIAFRQEEERRREAEQRRLEEEARRERQRVEEERRRQEAEARAARERAAREAAAAEAAARRAEEERRRAIEREADEIAAAMRNMGDEELVAELEGDDPLRVGAAQTELDARRVAREAQERAAAAAQAEEEARALEAAQKAAPLPDVIEARVAPVGVTRGPTGAAHGTRRWTFEVLDAAAVPDGYKVVDEKAIRQAVRDGVREIAGVRIYREDGLSVRSR